MSNCNWCGEDLSGPPRTVYYDDKGKKYCERFCRDESQKSKNETEDTMIEAWFDGCCEPVNPGGTAAYGVVILKNSQKIFEASKLFVPINGREKETSNNVAEYSGFKAILDYLIEHDLTRSQIIVYGDSKLVIKQMFGRWRIKSGYYVPIAKVCKALLKQFPNITGKWIPREQNGLADELSKAQLKGAGVKFRIQKED